MWISHTGSLRAGALAPFPNNGVTFWDPDSIGLFSTAFGLNNRALGQGSMSWGYFNKTADQYSTAWGESNSAHGLAATSWGIDNQVTANLGTAWGAANIAGGIGSTVWGSDNLALSFLETVFGRFAEISYGNFEDWISTDPLFVIGNGISEGNRHNALTILKNGKTGIGTRSPITEVHVRQSVTPTYQPDTKILNLTGLTIENTVGGNSTLYVDNFNDLTFAFDSIQRSYISDATGDYVNVSDRRAKYAIRQLDDVLSKVCLLKPSSYSYKYNGGERTLGFIAQDVEEIFPEVIRKKNGYRSLAYDDFTVLAIKAIQELTEQVRKLEDEVAALKSAASSSLPE